ncbi:MAG: phenylacetic acid degradation protein PaaY [Burkholderiales bacterium]|nr:MAG: phenylacetic acid degradation protein PaaY [Burkholderiales bacterium]
MTVFSLEGVTPVVDPEAYVHPSAVLIGDVIVGAGCYVGPGASLRGDFGRIVMRAGSNLQDNCVVHGTPEYDTVLDEDAHVGHGAVIHCAQIGRDVLIGMNAVVMDRAVIGECAIVGAMSFVKVGQQIPPATLAIGAPARVVRELSEADIAWKRSGTAMYQELARRCLAGLVPTAPLARIEPDRGRVHWDLDAYLDGSDGAAAR